MDKVLREVLMQGDTLEDRETGHNNNNTSTAT